MTRQVQGHDLYTDIAIMGRPQILLKVLFKVSWHIVSNNSNNVPWIHAYVVMNVNYLF